MTPVAILRGIVRGKTIELEQEPGLADGQSVSVVLRPALSPGEGLPRAFGAWAEDGEELERFVRDVYRAREDHRPEPKQAIPLSRLEEKLRETLNECADSGQAVVVEMPDQRLIAIQTLDVNDDDSLVDELLQSNPAFQALAAKSKASPRKPFSPGSEG